MNSDWRIPRTLTALVGTAIAIAPALAVYFGLLNFSAPVGAVQSHGDCTGGVVSIIPDSADLATYDAGGDVVMGVCIKSGANMFGGEHSQVFTHATAGGYFDQHADNNTSGVGGGSGTECAAGHGGNTNRRRLRHSALGCCRHRWSGGRNCWRPLDPQRAARSLARFQFCPVAVGLC